MNGKTRKEIGRLLAEIMNRNGPETPDGQAAFEMLCMIAPANQWKHTVILRTACGCEKTIDMPDSPRPEIAVPIMSPPPASWQLRPSVDGPIVAHRRVFDYHERLSTGEVVYVERF